MNRLINISQVSKLLNLVDAKTGKPQNHIIRYWEKEFKQIDPKIINKRRYYSKKNLELLMLIKYLLKDRGMTIKGAKIILKQKINSLDEYYSHILKNDYFKERIKDRSNLILQKLKKIKNYGKKNTR